MRTTELIQGWLADRIKWVQYPNLRRANTKPNLLDWLGEGFRNGLANTPSNPPFSKKAPPQLPQTLLGTLFAMGVVAGWLVVFLCVGIPVLWLCYELLSGIFFGN